MADKCVICGVNATQRCSNCRQVAYCSKTHQSNENLDQNIMKTDEQVMGECQLPPFFVKDADEVEDWKKGHKAACKTPYKLMSSSELGRYAVAVRPISPGQVIMKEKPLILGPKMKSVPICLGCHAHLHLSSLEEEYYRCSRCTWPLCSVKCETSSTHTSECSIMADRNFKCPIKNKGNTKREVAYCVITPLRCLLLDVDKRKDLLNLESHWKLRRQTEIYRILQANLVPFMTKLLHLPFDEETIMKVAGVLDTNSYEVQCPSGGKVRGVYCQASMFAHDCRPNSKHYFTNNGEIVFIATTPIQTGDIISTTYTQSLWGTEVRREHLLGAKCFLCTCRRCADPTELDTYLGALRCRSCSSNFILSKNPLDPGSDWACRSCERILTAKEVCSIHVELQNQVQAVNKASIQDMKHLLQRFSKNPVVHKNLYEVIQVKYALTQKYEKILDELSIEELENRLRIVQDLLQVANVLEPGHSRLRGELLYDKQETELLLTKTKFRSGLLNSSQAKEETEASLKVLNEASEILKTEPDLFPLLEVQMKNIIAFTNYLQS